MARAAEAGFVDEACAVADQYTVAFGEKNIALMLNGDALTHQAVPCRLGEYALLLIDTGRSRPGSASRWNERLDQCHRALKMLQQESSLHSLCELPDRKSVVTGKSVSVRVDLGGRRFIQKKKTTNREKQ